VQVLRLRADFVSAASNDAGHGGPGDLLAALFDIRTPSGAEAGKESVSCLAIPEHQQLCHSAFVLGGDTCGIAGGNLQFDPLDADKDDYSQNCIGGAADEARTEYWQIHVKGQNVMFADGHAKWYKGFNGGEMTFGYNVMTNWITLN
jgi:prepilin-type processing-associated H-X9-DG protein